MIYIANPLTRVSVSQGLGQGGLGFENVDTAVPMGTAYQLSSEQFDVLLKKCNVDKR